VLCPATHLSLSAVLSALGQHETALRHAELAAARFAQATATAAETRSVSAGRSLSPLRRDGKSLSEAAGAVADSGPEVDSTPLAELLLRIAITSPAYVVVVGLLCGV
jgi:hypothetical protein